MKQSRIKKKRIEGWQQVLENLSPENKNLYSAVKAIIERQEGTRPYEPRI